jgi:cell division protein FtsQ
VLPISLAAPSRRGLLRRRTNRRTPVQRRPALVVMADALGACGRALGRGLRVAGKLVLVLGFVAGAGWGGRLGYEHVMASPRFAVSEISVPSTTRLPRDEILALAGVKLGDRLLALDTDGIAARVAAHPWAASARVRRQLPGALHIDVTERRAVAAVALGGLYLIDETGRPFKRATLDEVEGLPVLTGVERPVYVDHRGAAEAAFREALGVVAAWRRGAGRPPLGEVNIDPRLGFTVFLLEGGVEVRLGRGDYDRKLGFLDRIIDAVAAGGGRAAIARLRVVHLDGGASGRVPVELAPEPDAEPSAAAPAPRRVARAAAARAPAPTLANTLSPPTGTP